MNRQLYINISLMCELISSSSNNKVIMFMLNALCILTYSLYSPFVAVQLCTAMKYYF